MEESSSSSKENRSRDVLNRSQSWAAIRQVDRAPTMRKQSDPFVDDEPIGSCQFGEPLPLPLNEAHSYRTTTELTTGAVRRPLMLLETLAEHNNHSTPSRHSAASLKVHFRSLDDISSDNQVEGEEDEDFNLSISEGLSDQSRRRDQSGTIDININLCVQYKS